MEIERQVLMETSAPPIFGKEKRAQEGQFREVWELAHFLGMHDELPR
jgi:hypothetical protein